MNECPYRPQRPQRPQRPLRPQRPQITTIHAALFLLLSAVCSLAAYAEPASRNIEVLGARLKKAVDTCPRLSLQTIGEVRYDAFTAPLWCVTYKPEAATAPRVLLTAGVHGNEPAGIISLLRFIENLAKGTSPYSGIAFDIIPLVNPWGWVNDKRTNGKGLDINRDFASFKAKESEIIRDFTKSRTYDLILDHHEDGGAKGFYLYQIDNKEDALCKSIIAKQKALNFPVEQDEWMVILKTHDGIIKAPRWTLEFVRSVKQLSMANYFRLTRCARVYLFETPKQRPLDDRLAMYAAGVECLMESLKK